MTLLICDTATARAAHQPRMRLTLGVFAKARSIISLSGGATKLAVLQQVLSTICNPDRLPVAALLAARPDTIILHSPT